MQQEQARKNRINSAKVHAEQDTKNTEATNVRRKKKAYFVCLKEILQVKQQKDRDQTMGGNLSIFKNKLLEEFGRFLNDAANDEKKRK